MPKEKTDKPENMVIVEREKNKTNIAVAVIGGIFSILAALIGVLPFFFSRESPPDKTDSATTQIQEKSKAMQKLTAKMEQALAYFADEVKKRPVRVAIGKISYANSEVTGPLGARIYDILVAAIEKRPEFELVKRQSIQMKRGIRVVGHHFIETNYSGNDKRMTVKVRLIDPGKKVLKQITLNLGNVALKDLPSMQPVNAKRIENVLQSLFAKNTGSFALAMTTSRGERGAIYKDGEYLKLEVAASKTCYLLILYLQSDGQIVQIFPNNIHRNNRIEGCRVYKIPTDGSPFDFRINCNEDGAMEIIKAVASLNPLPEIPGEAIGYGLRGLKKNPAKIIKEYREKEDVVEAICTILTVK